MPLVKTPKRQLYMFRAEIDQIEAERAELARKAAQLRKRVARVLKGDEFKRLRRRERADKGQPREGSSASKALEYLRTNGGQFTLDELMAVVGTTNRLSFAVTMVKLKKAGLVRGGQRVGGFAAVKGRA